MLRTISLPVTRPLRRAPGGSLARRTILGQRRRHGLGRRGRRRTVGLAGPVAVAAILLGPYGGGAHTGPDPGLATHTSEQTGLRFLEDLELGVLLADTEPVERH